VDLVVVSAYLIESDKVVHDELVGGGEGVFVGLDVQPVHRLMLLKPSTHHT
jgi:hypothetical protein